MLNQNPKLYFRITICLRTVHSMKKFALSQDVTLCLSFELFCTRSLTACGRGESIFHCGMKLKLRARCEMLARTGCFMLTSSGDPLASHSSIWLKPEFSTLSSELRLMYWLCKQCSVVGETECEILSPMPKAELETRKPFTPLFSRVDWGFPPWVYPAIFTFRGWIGELSMNVMNSWG
jgi:hypothetical protein